MKHLNAVLLLCAVFAGYASADVKTYTSRTAWAAAVSGPTTINFGTAAPVAAGTFTSYQTPPGVTLSGVNFASTSRTAWAAAVSGPTTINFGTAAPVAAGTFTSYQTPPGVTLSGVNFASTRSGGIVSITSQTFCCSTYLRGSDQLVSNHDGTGIVVDRKSTRLNSSHLGISY